MSGPSAVSTVPNPEVRSGLSLQRTSDSAMLRGGHGEASSSNPSESKPAYATGLARHTLGIILLLTTVFLWTASQFLASTIFADNTYSKPYFVTYINSCFFALVLLPVLLRRFLEFYHNRHDRIPQKHRNIKYALLVESERSSSIRPDNGDVLLNNDALAHNESDLSEIPNQRVHSGDKDTIHSGDRLNLRETAWLSFEFSILWFVANYFTAACLNYTSVASSTILTSTSSIWTLMVGAGLGVEEFSFKKVTGVIASFAGVILTSTVDISGENEGNRGSFPRKSPRQIGIGDALALLSAVLYGIYTTVMKKKIGDEARVNMPLFFGFVGLFNMAHMDYHTG
ncbi:MAG: hypothetical protein Q9218_000900 [Villophora microphyllina]